MTTLSQITTEDEWPQQAGLFNDDDLVIEVIMGEADPDGLADSFITPFSQFKAEFEADMAWIKQTVKEMSLC